MKRWKPLAFIALLLINSVVIAYAYQTTKYRSSDFHAGFPIAKDAERIEQSEGLTIYSWDKAGAGGDLPLSYRLIIWQRGWEEVSDQGPTRYYQKGDYEIMLTALEGEISLHDVPGGEGE
ncbi:hypothetical protein MKY84_12990 [Chryseomicrobium sp. FSL W7-1435]|uniref:hypothetical protein n=1 Tax=Chryseomicrobium sp. FSL W7-1435 TaxID=2921704 RepID=UPI00315A35AF